MKQGKASCKGAITVMNAIPTGIGSALGISLQTDAEVDIEDGNGSIEIDVFEKGENDQLARECVIGVFEKAGITVPRVTVRTMSSIPISRGLKSSSTAANAITLATVRSLDMQLEDLDIIKIGVEAAKRAGVTVTGALDDASACYFGGVVVTNNLEMRVIKRDNLENVDWQIILHVPREKIRKSGLSASTFSSVIDRFAEVQRLVQNGQYLDALTLNGELCSEALGLKTDTAHRALEAGALAAGLTGTGPATAIVCDQRSCDDVMSAVMDKDSEIIIAELNTTPAPEVTQWRS